MGRRSITVGPRRRTAVLSPQHTAAAAAQPEPTPDETPPPDAPVEQAVTEDDLHAVYADVVQLASRPLQEPRAGAPSAPARAVPPDNEAARLAVLEGALQVANRVTSAVEASSPADRAYRDDLLRFAQEQSKQAMDAVTALAGRTQPVPDVHVHVPETPVAVNVEGSHIHMPEQQPPQVDVHMPELPAAAPVHVDVHVPEQKPSVVNVAAAAPVVEVLPAPVHVQAPEPRKNMGMMVDTDAEGRKVFVPVELED